MVREGFEDYKRWKSDKTDNSQLSHCFHEKEFAETEWKDIRQGDYIRIHKDEMIPADVLILISSASSGISYVETSSLDG
jgi:magnesium-transporting ATPase (P-type)